LISTKTALTDSKLSRVTESRDVDSHVSRMLQIAIKRSHVIKLLRGSCIPFLLEADEWVTFNFSYTLRTLILL